MTSEEIKVTPSIVLGWLTMVCGIPAILYTGFAHHDISHGRNTKTIGKINSIDRTDAFFSLCFANVTYMTTSEQRLMVDIKIPCNLFPARQKLDFELPLKLCYNRIHPDNVAFDNDDSAEEKSCSRWSYEDSISMLFAAKLLTCLTIIFFLMFLCSFIPDMDKTNPRVSGTV